MTHVPDIAVAEIPPGWAYQWCTRDDAHQYDQMVTSGWQPVPASRHPFLRSQARDTIEFGNSILMEKPREAAREARELNEDKAHGLAAEWAKQVTANGFTIDAAHVSGQPPLGEREVMLDNLGPLRVRLPADMWDKARQANVSAHRYATFKIKNMLAGAGDGRDALTPYSLVAFTFYRIPLARRPKYPWLRWLFELISVEV